MYQGPLCQFQHTKAKKEDVRKLLQAINRASDTPSVTDQQLQVSFDRGWTELEEKLRDIPVTTEVSAPKRTERELIEESLTLLRKLAAGEDDSYLSPVLNVDNQDWSSLEILKYKFELIETQSVPPFLIFRPEVDELVLKARRQRTRIKNLRGEIPLQMEVFWGKLMQLREDTEDTPSETRRSIRSKML